MLAALLRYVCMSFAGLGVVIAFVTATSFENNRHLEIFLMALGLIVGLLVFTNKGGPQ